MPAAPPIPPTPPRHRSRSVAALAPGLLLAGAVALAALGAAALEARLLGHAVVDALVVAILLGMLVRSAWTPPAAVEPGIDAAAREVLEVAVLLLGVSVDLPLLLRSGPALAAGIALLVALGIATGLLIGRALGLPPRLALLVACGNAICGNSAIAAIAPVIDAPREHVASAIAFTAILGVGVVVGLPLLIGPLALSDYQYGVLAGLTVYAVPQVLAATLPVSALSGQVGTLVKLARVLLLGPVVVTIAVVYRRQARRASGGAAMPRVALGRVVPWFVVGFLLLATLRSTGLLPEPWVAPTRTLSSWLTLLAMAGLGLGVDVRALRGVGRAVVLTALGALVMLVVLALALIRVLGIG